MNLLWRLSREAIRYRKLYVIAILSTLGLTAVNLAAPRALSAMTGIVERGMDASSFSNHRISDNPSHHFVSAACRISILKQLSGA